MGSGMVYASCCDKSLTIKEINVEGKFISKTTPKTLNGNQNQNLADNEKVKIDNVKINYNNVSNNDIYRSNIQSYELTTQLINKGNEEFKQSSLSYQKPKYNAYNLESIIESPSENNIKEQSIEEVNLEQKTKSLRSHKRVKSYNLFSDSKILIKNDLANKANNNNKNDSSSNLININYYQNIIHNNPEEIILQSDFIFSKMVLNTKLKKAFIEDVRKHTKHLIMTKIAIKIYKSKNSYIIDSNHEEINIKDITKIELITNLFSKIQLYTINFIFGKTNSEISISSDDLKKSELWFKFLEFLIK